MTDAGTLAQWNRRPSLPKAAEAAKGAAKAEELAAALKAAEEAEEAARAEAMELEIQAEAGWPRPRQCRQRRTRRWR